MGLDDGSRVVGQMDYQMRMVRLATSGEWTLTSQPKNVT